MKRNSTIHDYCQQILPILIVIVFCFAIACVIFVTARLLSRRAIEAMTELERENWLQGEVSEYNYFHYSKHKERFGE